MSDPGRASLSVATPQPQANPLSMIEGFADVQNKINTNKLFQQTFIARQRAGQILANAPSMDEGLKLLQSDPITAPFAPEVANSVRQLEQTMTQIQGEKQIQAQHGLELALKLMPSVAAEPRSWGKVMKGALGTMSPSAREAVAPALEMMGAALTDDLPADDAAAKLQFKQRMNGMLLAGGVTPDAIKGIYGTPGTVDLGGRIQPTLQAPAAVGGGMSAVGGSFGKSLAPTVIQGPFGEGGAEVPVVMGGGGGNGGTARAPSANPLMPSAAGSRSAAPAGGGGARAAGMSGPTMVEKDYFTHRGADAADYEKNMDDRVGSGSTLRKNLEEYVGAAKEAQTGGGAETYMKLGSLLQALGVKNETVDKWANGSLAASQVMDKVALSNSMSQLKQQLTGVGGSRLNAQEFVAYMNKNPNLTTDPRALVQMFGLWQQFYDRDLAEQRALDKAKLGKATGDSKLDSAIGDGKFNIARWPALWNQSSFMDKFAPGGDLPVAGVKGTAKPANARKSLLDKYK